MRREESSSDDERELVGPVTPAAPPGRQGPRDEGKSSSSSSSDDDDPDEEGQAADQPPCNPMLLAYADAEVRGVRPRGRVVVGMAMIDILQPWDFLKRLERAFKGRSWGGQGRDRQSAIEPAAYSVPFVGRVRSLVGADDSARRRARWGAERARQRWRLTTHAAGALERALRRHGLGLAPLASRVSRLAPRVSLARPRALSLPPFSPMNTLDLCSCRPRQFRRGQGRGQGRGRGPHGPAGA